MCSATKKIYFFFFIGVGEIVADETTEDVETIDLDLGSFKEGSRTGKANRICIHT